MRELGGIGTREEGLQSLGRIYLRDVCASKLPSSQTLISPRIGLSPSPRVFQHGPELRILRLPAPIIFDTRAAGNHNRRIPGAAVAEYFRDLSASYLFKGLKDFQHAEPTL